MTEFKKLQEAVKKQFNDLKDKSNFIFSLNLDKNELWEVYLNSFPEGTNDIYRERREHDCSACRNFINKFGDKVFIIDNKKVSVWDFKIDDNVYNQVIKTLSEYIKNKEIKNVWFSKEKDIGQYKDLEDNEGVVKTWYHFYLELPNKFIVRNNDNNTKKICKYRDIRQVLERSLNEISSESINTVLELINQKSLYRGEEWKKVLEDFKKLQQEYKNISSDLKNNFLWKKSTEVGVALGKLKNHSMGTLLINISEGMDLDIAVKKYEDIVAPTNYKRPKPIFTEKMLEDAKKKMNELGFLGSVQRRFAILEDININNVLFSNKDVETKLQSDDVFENIKEQAVTKPKNFEKIEEIQVEDFINNVLPTAKEIEVYLDNKHINNMVSLIAPKKGDCQTMFKWDNNFSWAYTGNITDLNIKSNVNKAGGKVDGILRFSIQWNDEDIHNQSDYDAHCIEPKGNHIFYSRRNNDKTSGKLDIDILEPEKNVPAVENITWTNKQKMEKGMYKFWVHNYNKKKGDSGFRAEIEFNGEKYFFNYPHELKDKEDIHVADVEFDGENFKINKKLKTETQNKSIWNLKTNQFVPVSVIMYSPNYWNEQQGIGNKHYMFMLKDCKNDENPNGFFNEYLNNKLIPHRKVMECLSNKMKVEYMDNQLSGVGFSSTKRNEVIVKVKGYTERILKIKI